MSDIQVIVPAGMFGANEFDSALDKFLRAVGEKHQEDGGWGEKYGADVDNETFMMKPFCWCDDESCLHCIHGDHPEFNSRLAVAFGNEDKSEPYNYSRHAERHYYDPPNFWYKPLDFRVTWYKYIGRDTCSNKDLTQAEFGQMWRDCLGEDEWEEVIGS